MSFVYLLVRLFDHGVTIINAKASSTIRALCGQANIVVYKKDSVQTAIFTSYPRQQPQQRASHYHHGFLVNIESNMAKAVGCLGYLFWATVGIIMVFLLLIEWFSYIGYCLFMLSFRYLSYRGAIKASRNGSWYTGVY